ncbi:MAG: helix-turn-helix transcriptional regulator [Clostridia bacterium]|nr:helix-turn-helix transcriptional regulator [Clostridia bacterium]
MSVGKRIRLYLTEKGISQTWVSEQSKIALPKLNASLNDKRKLDVEEFSSIINVLNEDANKFLNN